MNKYIPNLNHTLVDFAEKDYLVNTGGTLFQLVEGHDFLDGRKDLDEI
jgi:hypothetical protein